MINISPSFSVRFSVLSHIVTDKFGVSLTKVFVFVNENLTSLDITAWSMTLLGERLARRENNAYNL